MAQNQLICVPEIMTYTFHATIKELPRVKGFSMLISTMLLAATAPIDVAIPGVIGLLMVAFPNLAFKKTGKPEVDASRTTKARWLGALLLVVAGIYACVMYLRPTP